MRLTTLPLLLPEGHRLVPVPEEHAAADVLQGTGPPQTADPAAGLTRPRLPALQLHLHGQQLHTRSGVCAVQTQPQVTGNASPYVLVWALSTLARTIAAYSLANVCETLIN